MDLGDALLNDNGDIGIERKGYDEKAKTSGVKKWKRRARCESGKGEEVPVACKRIEWDNRVEDGNNAQKGE